MPVFFQTISGKNLPAEGSSCPSLAAPMHPSNSRSSFTAIHKLPTYYYAYYTKGTLPFTKVTLPFQRQFVLSFTHLLTQSDLQFAANSELKEVWTNLALPGPTHSRKSSFTEHCLLYSSIILHIWRKIQKFQTSIVAGQFWWQAALGSLAKF